MDLPMAISKEQEEAPDQNLLEELPKLGVASREQWRSWGGWLNVRE